MQTRSLRGLAVATDPVPPERCHYVGERCGNGRPIGGAKAALSTWLNAGVDPTEVAERAGNSVEVLLTRYAKCLDGRQEVANLRIEDLLREYE